MNGLHSLWPLFSTDLALARDWLRPQLLQAPVRVRSGHMALSLGLVAEVEALLARPEQLERGAAPQWRFRLARLRGEANPYAELVPETLQHLCASRVEYCLQQGGALPVSLNGGLGDHLEALSLLVPWARRNDVALTLQTSRQHQLAPLLSNEPTLTWCPEPGLPVMAVRHLLCARSASYRSWIEPLEPPTDATQGWLCCWRAEGAGDRFSAHARSVPFALVRGFYTQLLGLVSPEAIIDISRWTPWEAQQLSGMGIHLHDPSGGTLAELAVLAQQRQVISIDTALAHLCAAMGKGATLLLPRFCDERWSELHRPHNSYGICLQSRRSTQFGSWSAVLTALGSSLSG